MTPRKIIITIVISAVTITSAWTITSFSSIHELMPPPVWVGRMDTQCSDPWDAGQININQYKEYIKSHPDYKFTDINTGFLGIAHVIEKYYEMKGLTILDLALVEGIEAPDACEGCGCNNGGFMWFMLIPTSEIDKLGGQWGVILDEKILEKIEKTRPNSLKK